MVAPDAEEQAEGQMLSRTNRAPLVRYLETQCLERLAARDTTGTAKDHELMADCTLDWNIFAVADRCLEALQQLRDRLLHTVGRFRIHQ